MIGGTRGNNVTLGDQFPQNESAQSAQYVDQRHR
jgi:hypothetical protein